MTKKHTTTLLLSFLFISSINAAVISGTVSDPARQPIAGASVSLDDLRATVTDANGAFAFDVPPGVYRLRVTHPAFHPIARPVGDGEQLELELQPGLAETITVSGIRAEAETPVTKTDIPREEIQRQYHGQDIPLLMRDTPSIHAFAESGVGGSGYSYITLRGISPTRINFTLDGVPLADSEDFGTFFADFPDLARSLQSIQIQRGVGTSTVGSPAFGGSVNLESIELAQETSTTAEVAIGSFGARQATVGYQSGFLPGGFAIYSRLSYIESDGFRRNSGIEQRNLFVSASKMFENAQLKLTGFSGHEDQQLAFYATDADTLATDLRANPLTPDETDSFGYDLAHLQYMRGLAGGATMTASAYYQRGYGWYRLYDDNIAREGLRQYGLDGMLLGTMATLSHTRGPVTASYGVHVNRFEREHTRDLVDGPRDYFNYGVKQEANAFAKLQWDRARWHLYGDAQVRYTDFAYHGDIAIDPISWTFFNPKIGARFDVSPRASVYASAGMSTREPTRNDLFLGEDNASVAHDLHAVKPERLVDFEAGFELRERSVAVAANVYNMRFRNEIAATGELSDIGLALRRNVDRSYRRGIELDLTWQATPSLRFRTDANLSRNRIARWTQFYDVYDATGSYVTSTPITFRDVEPLLTPPLIVNQAVEWTPSPRWSAGAIGRWVARSYLDNTNSEDLVAPSYFSLDGNASFAVTKALRLKVHANNLLNEKRIYPSGYSYQYFEGDTRVGIPYFYPQATRNVMVTLDFRLE